VKVIINILGSKVLMEFHFKVKLLILINPLNDKLNPTRHLLALLGAHHILHVSRVRVKVTAISDKQSTNNNI
jgi:hypothetical protein